MIQDKKDSEKLAGPEGRRILQKRVHYYEAQMRFHREVVWYT